MQRGKNTWPRLRVVKVITRRLKTSDQRVSANLGLQVTAVELFSAT